MSFPSRSAAPPPDIVPIPHSPNLTRLTMPIRIDLCPHDTETEPENIMKYQRDHKEKHLKALGKSHLLIEQKPREAGGWHFARWNPDKVPGPRDVKKMLDWYVTKNLFNFPRVKSVKLLGTGFTNVYFLVRFYIGAGEQAAVPDKVILRFSAPLYVSEDSQKDFDSRLDHEIAAMCWVRRTGKVPRVFVYDPTAQNELRLEWLVMEPIEGFVLRKCLDQDYCTCASGLHGLQPVGRSNPFYGPEEKRRTDIELQDLYDSFIDSGRDCGMVDELGKFIGGLDIEQEGGNAEFKKGRFMDQRFDVARLKSKTATNRGPFPTFEHYFDELFSVAYHDRESGNVYALKVELERQLKRQGFNYRDFFDKIREEEAQELYVHNLNLDEGNILVDENGKIKAVMGWEDALVFPSEWFGHITDLVVAIGRIHDERYRPLNEVLAPFRYFGRWGFSGVMPYPKLGFGDDDHRCPDSHLYSSTHFDINEARTPEPKKGFLKRIATKLKDL
ncbi:hypothetical protein CKAH01_14838 [Colletotrichum kahawae]|uniref:Aminoglycoside phosphotransferase domain-containing protein n=1 Tax=Colletotrichum kahawae TaxID=34407 RepID=A0AAD9YKZ0_COLKA|nr:hypothetical protein CKAH01_14838 [Colletotrichum kahawae]